MKRIGIINGPNLNLLGERETHIYGNTTFGDFFERIQQEYPSLELTYHQSNHEGAIIDKLHEWRLDKDGILLNAGAYTHYSIAIADAIRSINVPVIEVHISNIFGREDFRRRSVIGETTIGLVSGFGLKSYMMALNYFVEEL